MQIFNLEEFGPQSRRYVGEVLPKLGFEVAVAHLSFNGAYGFWEEYKRLKGKTAVFFPTDIEAVLELIVLACPNVKRSLEFQVVVQLPERVEGPFIDGDNYIEYLAKAGEAFDAIFVDAAKRVIAVYSHSARLLIASDLVHDMDGREDGLPILRKIVELIERLFFQEREERSVLPYV